MSFQEEMIVFFYSVPKYYETLSPRLRLHFETGTTSCFSSKSGYIKYNWQLHKVTLRGISVRPPTTITKSFVVDALSSPYALHAQEWIH